jgi:uncharacterized protein YqhQ
VIAGVSYEIIRFSGRHAGNRLVRFLMTPNLWLQNLTTRQPDDAQMEVAIAAMRTALDADEGREAALGSAPRLREGAPAPQPAADPPAPSGEARPQA